MKLPSLSSKFQLFLKLMIMYLTESRQISHFFLPILNSTAIATLMLEFMGDENIEHFFT